MVQRTFLSYSFHVAYIIPEISIATVILLVIYMRIFEYNEDRNKHLREINILCLGAQWRRQLWGTGARAHQLPTGSESSLKHMK
jgi:hypothetical protein